MLIYAKHAAATIFYAGLGIGRALAERVLERASSLGYSSVSLSTSNGQVGAQRMYRKMGFKRTGGWEAVHPVNKVLSVFHGLYVVSYEYHL